MTKDHCWESSENIKFLTHCLHQGQANKDILMKNPNPSSFNSFSFYIRRNKHHSVLKLPTEKDCLSSALSANMNCRRGFWKNNHLGSKKYFLKLLWREIWEKWPRIPTETWRIQGEQKPIYFSLFSEINTID